MPKRRYLKFILVGLALLGWWNWERLVYYRFDSQSWLSAPPERRYFMARYLIDRGKIKKWSREEAIRQLGRPDDRETETLLQYKLGRERRLIPLDGFLVLQILFDQNGTVIGSYIETT